MNKMSAGNDCFINNILYVRRKRVRDGHAASVYSFSATYVRRYLRVSAANIIYLFVTCPGQQIVIPTLENSNIVCLNNNYKCEILNYLHFLFFVVAHTMYYEQERLGKERERAQKKKIKSEKK